MIILMRLTSERQSQLSCVKSFDFEIHNYILVLKWFLRFRSAFIYAPRKWYLSFEVKLLLITEAENDEKKEKDIIAAQFGISPIPHWEKKFFLEQIKAVNV